MAKLSPRERKKLLKRYAGQALTGLVTNPTIAIEVAGSAHGGTVPTITVAAWRLAMEMVAYYEDAIEEPPHPGFSIG